VPPKQKFERQRVLVLYKPRQQVGGGSSILYGGERDTPQMNEQVRQRVAHREFSNLGQSSTLLDNARAGIYASILEVLKVSLVATAADPRLAAPFQ
jgi:hypothetical protein